MDATIAITLDAETKHVQGRMVLVAGELEIRPNGEIFHEGVLVAQGRITATPLVWAEIGIGIARGET